MLRACLLLGVWTLGCQSPRAIELEAVPERIVLPLPEGSNQFLNVKVTGRPKVVWVAAADEGAVRLSMASAGEGRYRINLADERVAEVLTRAEARSFNVYADFGGDQLSAGPVQFAVDPDAARRARGAPVFEVVAGGQARPGADGSWHAPAELEAVQVRWPKAGDRVKVLAMLGGERLPMRAGPDGTWQLAVDQALADRWTKKDALQVTVREGNDTHGRVSLRARPDRLVLTGASARLTVHQRRSAPVPGSQGFLRVLLGDITAGQVRVSVQAGDGGVVVEPRAMRPADVAPLPFGEQTCSLALDRMVNHLVGDDFAEFRVLCLAPPVVRGIARRIQRVAESKLRFSDADGPVDAKQAAERLRALTYDAPTPPASLVDFLERVRGTSLKVEGRGRTWPLAEWLGPDEGMQ